MSHANTLSHDASSRTTKAAGGSPLIFLYGILCYVLGVSGLVWLILVTLGFVPFADGPIRMGTQTQAILFNLGLVALFGVQHAVMARPAFKARWTKIVPPAAERSTFTMLAGLLMANMMFLWQPLTAQVWAVEQPAIALALRVLCGLGWGYMLLSTFAIDHFELFGLKQVYRQLRGLETPAPNFQQRWMYRFDRHPLMTGAMVGLWSTPDMRVDNLVLALAMTLYVIIGVSMEERDLVRAHGEAYRSYRNRVATTVPLLGAFREKSQRKLDTLARG